MGQIGLTITIRIIILGLGHRDIGRDAKSLNGAAGRRVITRCRQTYGTLVANGNEGLDRTFAEGLFAKNDGTVMILQSAGHDFTGRGRTAIRQDDDRQAIGDVRALGIPALVILGMTATDRDDFTVLDEVVRNGNGLIELAPDWSAGQG